MYVKVNNTNLIKCPYTFADLREENPYSRYDGRFTLPEWYAQTDEGMSSGNTVAVVKTAEPPDHDADTQYVEQKSLPELHNGEWVLGWSIIDRPVSAESFENDDSASPEQPE